MPGVCLLMIAPLAAAQPLPGSHPATIGATSATAATTARRATIALRTPDRPRRGADSMRVHGDLARLNADPPRLTSGYRAGRLDLRWHAADVIEPYPR